MEPQLAEEPDDPHLAIELYPAAEYWPDAADEDDEFRPAAGKHRASAGRVTITGDRALSAASRGICDAVRHLSTELAQQLERPSPGLGSVTSAELTFGLKLTVGSGDLIKTVLTAGGEASVQVKLTLTPQRTER